MDTSGLTLKDSLLATLAYFDLKDRPLTFSELRRFRLRGRSGSPEPTLAEMDTALEGLPVCVREGNYHLEGRGAVVDTRVRRHRIAERKCRRALAFAKLARFVPSVRMIALSGSAALSNADEGSDIDIAVVVMPGTIWITRLLLTGSLALFDLRPRSGREADTFCMSFFMSEDAMDLSDVLLPDGDIELRYWAASFVPLYDAGGVMVRFIRENAALFAPVPDAPRAEVADDRRCGPAPRWTAIGLPLLKALEFPARRLQYRLFPERIRSAMNADTRVIVSDSMLKFHVTDTRARMRDAFRERVRGLGITLRL